MKVADGVDGTAETDYTAEREDPTFRDLPDPLSDEPLAGPPPGSAAAPSH
jgi:SSS family solute:Na+ symporter